MTANCKTVAKKASERSCQSAAYTGAHACVDSASLQPDWAQVRRAHMGCQKAHSMSAYPASVMRDPGAGEDRTIPVDSLLADDRGFGTIYVVSPGITRIPSPLSFSWVLCKTYCMMASSTGNLPACHLLGVTVASALYSVYVLAFGASIHFLFNVRGRRVRPNKIILAVSVIIFLCITAARPASPLKSTAHYFRSNGAYTLSTSTQRS
jgi:hypothetical protein